MFFRVPLYTADYQDAVERQPAALAAIIDEIKRLRGGQQAAIPWSGMTGDAWLALSEDERDGRTDTFIAEADAAYAKNPKAATKMYREAFGAAIPTTTLPAGKLKTLIVEAQKVYDLLKAAYPEAVKGKTFEDVFENVHGVKLNELAKHQLERAAFDHFVPEHMIKNLRDRGFVVGKGLTLAELIDAFNSDHRRQDLARTTKTNHKRSNEVLLNVLGPGTLIKQIRRSDIERVVKTLRYLPKDAERHPDFAGSFVALAELTEERIADAAATGDECDITLVAETSVNKYLGNIQTVFKWALEQQHIDANPAMGIKLKGVGKSKKRRFTEDELRKLFPAGYKCEGISWLPLIALHQGMRGNEISQLLTADISEVDGVHCIRVMVEETGDRRLKPNGDGRSLKTRNARRDLPIHRTLIELGFVDYVKCRRENGHEYLFDVKQYSNGTHYDSIRDEIGDMIRDAGVYIEGETSFHSLRHSWTRGLRDAGVPEDQRKALGGWSDGRSNGYDCVSSAEEIYGQGFSPKTLKAALDKIEFPILDQGKP